MALVCLSLMVSIFSYTCWSFVYILGEMSIQFLSQFLIGLLFFLLLNYRSFLLTTNCLLELWFANNFYHFVGLYFVAEIIAIFKEICKMQKGLQVFVAWLL